MSCNVYVFQCVCYVMLCYAMLCHAMLCYAMLCYTMSCYARLRYAMLCCFMPDDVPNPILTALPYTTLPCSQSAFVGIGHLDKTILAEPARNRNRHLSVKTPGQNQRGRQSASAVDTLGETNCQSPYVDLGRHLSACTEQNHTWLRRA